MRGGEGGGVATTGPAAFRHISRLSSICAPLRIARRAAQYRASAELAPRQNSPSTTTNKKTKRTWKNTSIFELFCDSSALFIRNEEPRSQFSEAGCQKEVKIYATVPVKPSLLLLPVVHFVAPKVATPKPLDVQHQNLRRVQQAYGFVCVQEFI